MSSIKNQLVHGLHVCNSFGESKSRAKHDKSADTEWKIYSVAEMTELISTAKDLGSFLKETFPEVKKVVQIKPFMIQSWLNGKTESCSQITLAKEVSLCHKLDHCCNHAYRSDFRSDRLSTPVSKMTDGSVKTKVMDEDRYKILLDKMRENKDSAGRAKPSTETWKSPMLSHICGLRVEETAKVHLSCVSFTGGKYGYGTVSLRSGPIDGAKGGRPRTIDILTEQDREDLKNVCDGVKRGQTIIRKPDGSPYDKSSLTKAIQRAMSACDKDASVHGKEPVFGKDWTFNKNHTLRKSFAQRCYDAVRAETNSVMSENSSKKAAEAYVNRQLGHGEKRTDELETYVEFRW